MSDRKRIAFITSGRSDFALLKPLLAKLKDDKQIDAHLIATGTHMTKYYGKTIREIDEVNDRVDILMQSNNPVSIANSIGLGVIKFSETFIKRSLDAIFLMGDRFEMVSAAIAGHCMNVPMIHAYGGEVTLGSLDDGWRNTMTMLAQYHLTAHEQYSDVVRRMKPVESNQVWTVGSLSVDNIKETKCYELGELTKRFHARMDRFRLVTYHPDTTRTRDENISDFQQLLHAIDARNDAEYIITFANQDSTGTEFNRMIMEYKGPRENVKYIRHCGVELYLSLVKHAEMVIGNSSSGISEAPYYGTPTVNIGRRQMGRIMADSVYPCPCEKQQIVQAMDMAKRTEPCGVYGDGAADNIIEKLRRIVCGS
jgi:GDP/UDP-N,N'-diacetylbacillosamine 2-epimerase (hydrolysing)